MLKRPLLAYVACLLIAACYAWLRVTRLLGTPDTLDVPRIVIDMLMLVMVGALVYGAWLLWRTTRHLGALLQLITSAIVFAFGALDQFAKALDDAHMPQVWDFIRRPPVEFAVQVVFLLCMIAFPAAYIWYAHSRKSI
jgi:hypothetical protein